MPPSPRRHRVASLSSPAPCCLPLLAGTVLPPSPRRHRVASLSSPAPCASHSSPALCASFTPARGTALRALRPLLGFRFSLLLLRLLSVARIACGFPAASVFFWG